jgi:hypothetical protein
MKSLLALFVTLSLTSLASAQKVGDIVPEGQLSQVYERTLTVCNTLEKAQEYVRIMETLHHNEADALVRVGRGLGENPCVRSRFMFSEVHQVAAVNGAMMVYRVVDVQVLGSYVKGKVVWGPPHHSFAVVWIAAVGV